MKVEGRTAKELLDTMPEAAEGNPQDVIDWYDWNHDALQSSLESAWELQLTFELRWKADMRAITRWRDANPGNELVLPDHADLVVWLLEQLEKPSR